MSREIFVFGSNLAGRHGAGGALHARTNHGAIYGEGKGLQGNSYAIPTKDGRPNTPNLREVAATLPLAQVAGYVNEFIEFAKKREDWTFNVGKLGCSLAAHSEADMIKLFAAAPANCNLPEGWRKACNTDVTSATNSADTCSQTVVATSVQELCPKTFKLVIAGGRHFDDYSRLEQVADRLLKVKVAEGAKIHIVCGEAKGADALGKKYAEARGFTVDSFPADWDRFGKSAGYRRNEQMAIHCDAVLAFWDGKSVGTKHMVSLAEKHKKPNRVSMYVN